MEGRTIYARADTLKRLKAHMVVTWRKRQRGTGVGYSSEYFRGMVSGLALADALDATVPFAIAAFITDRGYAVEVPYSG
ncbi:hypothetical protein R69927_05850 [Paraburkholderia domus]|uniref:hypothetical protein n=1 Tax=Paraburkholderia TaxID=1822464 RepID=UPI0019143317|nr:MULTISPECIES: hypothetical protein [Paraburkholderia]MBK5090566.1 hypothetical protein [Burkholderia sp. R-69927]USX06655.1 hypothetical protein NHH62_18845 [Paraburkholderia fungorum]CAE6908597.1 hypothetical protein R69927_05850 [Paraburkholderia domus]